MERTPQPAPERWRLKPGEILWTLNVLALLAAAVWFRCRSLENIPGTNGDEAWYGVVTLQMLTEGRFQPQTPTGNPLNWFFFGPLVLLHVFFPPSIALLRSVAVASGLVALVANWLFCRWVFDRRTATISTVVLAVLPINIAYSRFAWDASQSLLATLPVVYFSLAAVRFHRRRGQFVVAAVLAQIAAILVHPTNVFTGVAILAALTTRLRRRDLQRLVPVSQLTRGAATAMIVAAVLLVSLTAYGMTASGVSRFLGRMGGAAELLRPQAVPHCAVLFPRLFTGGTVYRDVAGSQSWWEWPCAEGRAGWGGDAVLFWIVVIVAASFLWKSWKADRRMEDRVLISIWALALAAFLLLAGPSKMTPGWQRYAICLVAPTALLVARGTAVFVARLSPGRAGAALAIVSLAGWLLLADFDAHYFRFIERTGGRGHLTFRTADIEPKRAALQTILQHRHQDVAGGVAGDDATTWIVASQWWNYWPIRYLSMAENDVRVLTAEEAEAAAGHESVLRQGRMWRVEFSDSRELHQARAEWNGREVRQWQFEDYGTGKLLCVLHAVGDAE